MIDACIEDLQPIQFRRLAHGGKELTRMGRMDVVREEGGLDARTHVFGKPSLGILRQRNDPDVVSQLAAQTLDVAGVCAREAM